MIQRRLQRNGAKPAVFALLLLLTLAAHRAWADPTDKIVYQTPSIFSPHSGPAQLIHNLSLFVMEITGLIFVVVGALLVFVIVRYRQHGAEDDSEPPQVYGSTQI